MTKEMHDAVGKCLEFSDENKSMHETLTFVLKTILKIANCHYGFIGETRYMENETPIPYYRIHALCGFPEHTAYTSLLEKNKYVDFTQPDTLHNKIFETRDIVICHDVMAHREGKPFPEGHPVLKNFIMFPLWFKDKISGVVGLSSDVVEFTQEWISALMPLITVTEHLLFISIEKNIIEDHKIRFLANISHELRTPLNAIVCTTKMLKDTLLTSEQIELLEIVTHCNGQLLDIINDILDYTKITLGNLALSMSPISLKKCILTITNALNEKIVSKNLVLRLHYNTDIDMIIGDETRITQIFLNLLNNSIKYTKAGSIDIYVDDDVHTADISSIKFRITDTGIGIPTHKLKYIFNSFNQITNHLCSDSGVGLGLPITKYLVNMFNGDITAESVFGQGTTITFTLRLQNIIEFRDKSQLRDYFNGKSMLVITNNDEHKTVFFNTLREYGIKPIISSLRDVKMYLSGDTFEFECIIISLGLDVSDLEAETILEIKYNCAKIIIDTPINIQDAYVYNAPLSVHALTKMLNELYIVGNTKKHSVVVETHSKSNINIIIAEDNLENQTVLVKILNKLDYYNITLVSDGLEFYIKLMENDYDIAFVDLKMPIMDGITAVKKFKENSKKGTSIVAITASVSETIRNDCYAAGMNGYITKPINWKELEIAMNMVMRKKVLTHLTSRR